MNTTCERTLCLCMQWTLRRQINLGHVDKRKWTANGCNVKVTLHGTMPNTDVHPLLLPLVNTNSLKAKPNLLQSVRRIGTLPTPKTVDFMITKLDGKV